MENVSKLKTLTILWHEGTGEFDGCTFTLWADAQKAIEKIFKQHVKGGRQGYTKVKVCVQWENGAEIVDRLDVGYYDYYPKLGTIGDYLKKFNSIMYGGNLNVGDRVTLSWNDGTWPTETVEPEHDSDENRPQTGQNQPKNSPPAGQPQTAPKTAKISPKTAPNSPKQPARPTLAKQPKKGRKTAQNKAENSPKQPETILTASQPENRPQTARKQPQNRAIFNLCFEYILELQVNTYLLN